MKKIIALTLLFLAINSPTLAQVVEQVSDAQISELAASETKAFETIQAYCDIKEADAKSLRQTSDVKLEIVKVRVVRLEWTGGCVNGKLDGEGSLTTDVLPMERMLKKRSGLMVQGVMVGPWLIEKTAFEVMNGVYEWQDAAIPGNYRKEADGSFRHVVFTPSGFVPSASTAPVSAAQVAQHIQAARAVASNSGQSRGTPFQSTLLQDLTRGAQVYRASSRSLGDTKTKSVMLVLSSNTLTSIDKLEDFQRRLMSWAAAQTNPDIRRAATEFALSADKKSLADNLTAALSEKFAKVVLADDLSGLIKKQTDFAVVFDWSFAHDFDAMISEQVKSSFKTPNQRSRESLGLYISPSVFIGTSYFIVNNNLELVRSDISNTRPMNFVSARLESRKPDAAGQIQALSNALNASAVTMHDALDPTGMLKFELNIE